MYDSEECNTGYTGNGNSATYTCDGNHTRVQKVVNGVTTVSVYSGSRVIAEYDNGAAVTAPTREYLYGHNLLAAVTGSTGGAGGTIIYQQRDHLSPRLYTDASGNNVGEQGTFPFGESWYNNSTTSQWVFTSYERDQESGNDYALARSYASTQGRFLSPDPLAGRVGDPQSWNRYAYVDNDPINLRDPSGQGFWDEFIELFGVEHDNDTQEHTQLGQSNPVNFVENLSYSASASSPVPPGTGSGWGIFQDWAGATFKGAEAGVGAFVDTFNQVVNLGVSSIYDTVFRAPVDMLGSVYDGFCGPDGVGCAMMPVGGELPLLERAGSEVTALTKFYPESGGFAGTTERTFLMPGQLIDRYGGSGYSRFFSPQGTADWARSLPPGTAGQPLRTFEVVKPFEVESGTAAPWFNQLGGGQQYRTPVKLDTLLNRGIIKEVAP